jgi:hypothetical protein
MHDNWQLTTLPAVFHRCLQELAATCILRGWGAVLRLVLPQVATACTAVAAVAGIEQHLCGIPLLHAAGKSLV